MTRSEQKSSETRAKMLSTENNNTNFCAAMGILCAVCSSPMRLSYESLRIEQFNLRQSIFEGNIPLTKIETFFSIEDMSLFLDCIHCWFGSYNMCIVHIKNEKS